MGLKSTWVVAGAACAALLSPSLAAAGGTLVIAPKSPTAADCRPGSAPRYVGAGDDTLTVLGCVSPGGSRPVVIAGSLEHVYSCFYVAPPGGENEGPCFQVRSTGTRFGGRMTRRSRSYSPVTGGRSLLTTSVGSYRRGVYASGLAPIGTERVWLSHERGHARAALLPVRPGLGATIGTTYPFSVFVARLPNGIDTCQGLRALADSDGERLTASYRSGENRAYPSRLVPLPQSRACAANGAWEAAKAIKVVSSAVRELRKALTRGGA